MSKENTKQEIIKLMEERCGEVTFLENGDQSFEYGCMACGKCCENRKDENAILFSAYDAFRIAKGLGMKMGDMLDKYTIKYLGPDSGLLLFAIKTKDLSDGRNICSFLRNRKGRMLCSVHTFKPSICRLFPLGRVTVGSDEVGYILQHDVACQKRIQEKETYTVDEWVPERQEAEDFFIVQNQFVMSLLDIIDHKALSKSTALSPEAIVAYFKTYETMIYYNYDFEKDFLEQYKTNTEMFLDFAKAYVTLFSKKDKHIKAKNFKDFVENPAEAVVTLIQSIK